MTRKRKSYGRLAYHRRRRRNESLLNANPICQVCKSKPSIEVDHIIPLHRGGRETLANLQCLCKSCHRKKTKRELREYQINKYDKAHEPGKIIRRPR